MLLLHFDILDYNNFSTAFVFELVLIQTHG